MADEVRILATNGPSAPMSMGLSLSKWEWNLFFSKAEWNGMVRYAAQTAGNYWIAMYLPLRFEGYARAKGIYTGDKRGGKPLVHSGFLRAFTLGNSRARAKATSAETYLDLIIPTAPTINPKRIGQGGQWHNYNANPVVAQSLYAYRTITPYEHQRMGEIFSHTLSAMIEGASKRRFQHGARAGQMKRARLTPMQRSSIGLKPRKTSSLPERKKAG